MGPEKPDNPCATKPDRSICCQQRPRGGVQDPFTPADSRPGIDTRCSSWKRRVFGTRGGPERAAGKRVVEACLGSDAE